MKLPLQHASVRHRRDRSRRHAQAPRNRPRTPGEARVAGGALWLSEGTLFNPRGISDRIWHFLLDGERLRRQPRADGRGRADQGARRRHRDGPDQGRQPLCGALRHSGRRGSSGRHGLQGRRHGERPHRAADGHQDPGHHQGDHARGAEPEARGRISDVLQALRKARAEISRFAHRIIKMKDQLGENP